ncbi:hypothetical protein FF38_01704 [Lucilia cuprina]|uniref:Uncharacterized protein n=1 Tax=Lucilia cuprina TaxID=7375 RepID=A0A0L0CKB8_LUCCU|nr:hypothetical protein FF38_01704 [Lucilia cuprina]
MKVRFLDNSWYQFSQESETHLIQCSAGTHAMCGRCYIGTVGRIPLYRYIMCGTGHYGTQSRTVRERASCCCICAYLLLLLLMAVTTAIRMSMHLFISFLDDEAFDVFESRLGVVTLYKSTEFKYFVVGESLYSRSRNGGCGAGGGGGDVANFS